MKTLLKTKHTEVFEIDGIEMIKRPIACAILAIDENNDVIMVEQERGTFGTMLEVPAGKVEQGEDPLATAIRELQEETGYIARNVKPLISYFPSVGYSTEVINCYYTLDVVNTNKQRLDDGERINVKKFYWKDLMEMIHNGEIHDSKTLMCVLAYDKLVGF